MNFLKNAFRFYIHSSIHVAVCISALMGVGTLSYDLPFQKWKFIFVFFATISAYNFSKFAQKAGFQHKNLSSELKAIQVFSLLCFLFLGYAVFQQSLKFIFIASLLALLTLLYNLPFIPSKYRLRELKSFKIFIIALVWTGTTLWLLLIDQVKIFSIEVYLRSISYFAFVLALILPFEIRDLQFDDPKLGTFPQRFGISNTRKLGYIFLGIFLLCSFLNPNMLWKEKLICLIISGLVFLFLKFSKKYNSAYYTAFWGESIPIVWFLLLYLM